MQPNALTAFAASLLAATLALAQPSLPAGLENGGFETGKVGERPAGWFSPPGDTVCEVSAEGAPEGRQCVVISRKSGDADSKFINIMQAIDGKAFQGKQVSLKAMIRTRGEGRAQMWLRVDRPDGKMGFFDNMQDRPVQSDKWTEAAITAEIDDDAAIVNVGVFMNGPGRAWIDGFTLVATGAAGAGNIEPRPLEGRAVDNLVAFAQVLGTIRYFHPTDEGSKVNWDDFAIRAVQDLETPETIEDLAVRLNAWTKPICPTIQVWETKSDDPAPLPPPAGATHSVTMEYHGFPDPSMGQNNVYRSKRVVSPIAKVDPPAPPPGTFVTLDPGGVRIRIPIAIPSDGSHTLPRGEGALPETPARPEGWKPSVKDRATRLATVCLAWGTMKHFYPYFDVVNGNWDAMLVTTLNKAAEDTNAEQFYETLALLLSQTKDGHGYLRGPGAPAMGSHPFTWTWADDKLVVQYVDDPAVLLKPGDIVTAIDGVAVSELYSKAATLISAATDQWTRARALGVLRWANAPTPIKVTVERGGAEVELSVPRNLPVKQGVRHEPADGSEVAPGIVYFNLNGAETATLNSVMAKLQAAKGIIFDLRGYPGSAGADLLTHLSDEPIQSAHWNIPVITRPTFEQVTYTTSRWNLPPRQPRLTASIAFLTGGGAISYAESCIAIVENYQMGEIVGGITAGTNGNITSVRLPVGYAMTFTGMQVVRHDGGTHHGIGIRPTYPVSPTVEGILAGKDEVMDKAIEVLKEKIAAAAPTP